MYRRALIIALSTIPLSMTTALANAGTNPPADCQFKPGEVPGMSATMACYGALDRNGDGALAPDEATALPRLQDRFSDLDRDENGLLSPDEFQAEMKTPAQRAGGKGV